MITKFVKTTWKLWMDAPGQPPLWKCALVGLFVARAPKANMVGSIDIDELVEWESEERRCTATQNKE